MGLLKKTKNFYFSIGIDMGDPKAAPIAQTYVMNSAMQRSLNIGNDIIAQAMDGEFNNFSRFASWASKSKSSLDNLTFNEFIGYPNPTIKKTSSTIDITGLSNILSSTLNNEILVNTAEFSEDVEEAIIKKYILLQYGATLDVYNAPFEYSLDTDTGDEEEDESDDEPSYYIVTVDGYGTFNLMLDDMWEDDAVEDSFYVIEYNSAEVINDSSSSDSQAIKFNDVYSLDNEVEELTPTYEWETSPEAVNELPEDTYVGLEPTWFDELDPSSKSNELLLLLLDKSQDIDKNNATELVSKDIEVTTEVYELELGLPVNGIVPVSLGALNSTQTDLEQREYRLFTGTGSFSDDLTYLITEDSNGDPLDPSKYYRKNVAHDLDTIPELNTQEVSIQKSITIQYDQEGIPTTATIVTESVPVNKLTVGWDIIDKDISISGAGVLVDTESGNRIPRAAKDLINNNEVTKNVPAALPPILISKNGVLHKEPNYLKRIRYGSRFCYPLKYKYMEKQFQSMIDDPELEFMTTGKNNHTHYCFGTLIDTKTQLGIKSIIAWLKNNFDLIDMSAIQSGNQAKINNYIVTYNQWVTQNEFKNGSYTNPGVLTGQPLPKPPELELPSSFRLTVGVKESFNFRMTIDCAGIGVTTRTGKFNPNARVGHVGKAVVSDLNLLYSTKPLNSAGVPTGVYKKVTRVEWYTQKTDNSYEVITSLDLRYTTRVLGKNYKSAHASECISKVNDDEFNHSFFIPIQPSTVSTLNLLDRNQIFRDNRLLVSNIHIRKRVRRGWYAAALKIGSFIVSAAFGPLGMSLYAGYQVYKVNTGRQSWGEAIMAATGLEAFALTVDIVTKNFYAAFAKIFGNSLGKIIADIVMIVVTVVLTIITAGGYSAVMASSVLISQVSAQVILTIAAYVYNSYMQGKMEDIEKQLEATKNEYLDALDELDEFGQFDRSGNLKGVQIPTMVIETPDQFFSRSLMSSEEFINTLLSAVYGKEETALRLEI